MEFCVYTHIYSNKDQLIYYINFIDHIYWMTDTIYLMVHVHLTV